MFSYIGEVYHGDELLIPYIPYPINPNTGQPVDTKLKALDSRGDLRYGGSVSDATTGLHVPICGVTIHPQTGAALPVAGTHTDPVTALPVAIEIGSLMVDPDTEMAVPILSVAIDATTGSTT